MLYTLIFLYLKTVKTFKNRSGVNFGALTTARGREFSVGGDLFETLTKLSISAWRTSFFHAVYVDECLFSG